MKRGDPLSHVPSPVDGGASSFFCPLFPGAATGSSPRRAEVGWGLPAVPLCWGLHCTKGRGFCFPPPPPRNHFSYVFDKFEITSICNSSAQAQAAPPHSKWDGGDGEDIGTT